MKHSIAIIGLVLFCAAGCGGAARHAHPSNHLEEGSAKARDVATMVLPEAKAIFYLSAERLAQSPGLLEAFTTATHELLDDEDTAALRTLAETCALDVEHDVAELTMSVLADESFAVVARLDTSAHALVSCMGKQGSEQKVDGRTVVQLDDLMVWAVDDQIIVLGNAESLEMATEDGSPRWLKAVGQHERTIASVHVMVGQGGLWMLSGGIHEGDDGATLVMNFRGTTAEDADYMVNTFRATLPDVAAEVSSAWKGKKRRRMKRWLAGAEVRRTVVHGVELVVPLPASGVEQRLETLKTFAHGLGVRVDRRRSEDGARELIWKIAGGMRDYAMKHKTGWKNLPTLPASAPLTPSMVPLGEATTSTPEAWQHASWKAVDFRMEGQQHYAYQFETSADRRRATIRAVADFDGDGIQQVLELEVTVDADGKVVLAPAIDLQNAFE